jgi:hypothetical protein
MLAAAALLCRLGWNDQRAETSPEATEAQTITPDELPAPIGYNPPDPDSGRSSNGLPDGIPLPTSTQTVEAGYTAVPVPFAGNGYQVHVKIILRVYGSLLNVSTYAPTTTRLLQPEGDGELRMLEMVPSWLAIDARGTAAGWQLVLQASSFETPTGELIPANDATFELRDDQFETLEGNLPPMSLISAPQPLSDKQLVIAEAVPGTGMGSYVLRPRILLRLPEGAPPGTYRLELQVSIFTSP